MTTKQPPPAYPGHPEMDRGETSAPPQAATAAAVAKATVVTTQPRNIIVPAHMVQQQLPVNPGTHQWTTGVCGCMTDCGVCLRAWCCPCCAIFSITGRLGESCCIVCCVPGSLITLRTKLRLLAGIKGSICDDCVMVCLCCTCVMCQMQREMDNIGIGGGFC